MSYEIYRNPINSMTQLYTPIPGMPGSTTPAPNTAMVVKNHGDFFIYVSYIANQIKSGVAVLNNEPIVQVPAPGDSNLLEIEVGRAELSRLEFVIAAANLEKSGKLGKVGEGINTIYGLGNTLGRFLH